MLQAARVRTSGGDIGVLDWGGDLPALVLLHPNGFCAGLYEPVGQLLRDDARVIAIDLPGHGASHRPIDRREFAFEVMASRVVETLDKLGVNRAAVAGGSLGGAIAIMVDKLDPGRWSRALLAEAVAFPPAVFADRPATSVAPHEQGGGNAMAAGARRRRPSFAGRDEMIASLSTRPPLSQLADEAMAAYAHWGTVDGPDGVRLACTPEVEATIFEVSGEPGGAVAAWNHLPNLSCPTVIVAGRDTSLPDIFAEQARHAAAPIVLVDGGHFVLHEDSTRAAHLIRTYALAGESPPVRD